MFVIEIRFKIGFKRSPWEYRLLVIIDRGYLIKTEAY